MAALISLKKEHYIGSFLLPVRSACGLRLWRLLSLLVSMGFSDGFHGGRVACAVKVVACAPARLWRYRQAVVAVSVSLFLFLQFGLGLLPERVWVISIARLRTLPPVDLQPIDVIIFDDPYMEILS